MVYLLIEGADADGLLELQTQARKASVIPVHASREMPSLTCAWQSK